MRLLYLALENYQGLRSFSMEPNGHNVNIYADNGLGKSTIGNSISFVTTGKPMVNVKNYSIKTRGPDGLDIHYIDHSVASRWLLDDGTIITLKKVVSEDWREKRGSNESKLAGNPTSYYIDEVPAKETEFTMRLMNICNGERMKMLMLVWYFAEGIGWEERRRILLDICGNVSDEDVIASSPALAKLPEFLSVPGTSDQRYSVEDLKKIADSKKSSINDEIKKIPIKIAQTQSLKPEITAEDKVILSLNIGQLSTSQYLKKSEIDKLKEGGNDIIREQINEAMTDMSDARRQWQEQADKAAESVHGDINDLNDGMYDLTARKQEAENSAENVRRSILRTNDSRNRLLKKYEEVRQQFTESLAKAWAGDEACPTCGRPLPDDDVAAAKEQFNLAKSQKLESLQKELEKINQQGTEFSKDKIAVLEQDVKKYSDQAENLKNQIEELRQQIAQKRAKVSFAPFEQSAEYTRISAKLVALRSTGDKVDSVTAEKISTLQAEVEALGAQISDYIKINERVDQVAKDDKTIEDLKAQQKTLAKEFEHYKQGEFLCDEFIRTKVSMLDERINSRFKTVRFKLFDTQINDGLKECCDVLVPSPEGDLVEFKDANNGARINAGLEIISTLSEHWGVKMPVIIDNSESVQVIPDCDFQLIQTIVPLAWEKLGEVVRGALIEKYGTEEAARAAYEAPNKKLRVEVA